MASIPEKDVPATLAFLDLIKPANRHIFLQPSPSIPASSLMLVKHTLDAFASQISDEQQRSLREAGNKRKRSGADGAARADLLKIRKLYVDGFETGQVWQQAKRIISSALSQSSEVLRELQDSHRVETGSEDDQEDVKVLEFGGDGFEVDSDGEDSEGGSGESSSSGEHDSGEEELQDEDENPKGLGADDMDELAEDNDEEEENGEEGDEEEEVEEDDLGQTAATYVEDTNGLNDGFFSIDDFNRQTQWLEDQDARADPNTDQVSDEEALDWHDDPMSVSAARPKPRAKKAVEEDDSESDMGMEDVEEDDEEEEDGPTFGNMDLFAPEGESGDEGDEGAGDELDIDLTANDVFYKDFFAPPARKARKGGGKPSRAPNNKPSKPDDGEVERAMADVRRDLFEDISERSDSEDALSDVSAGDPKSRRSAHERRQVKLMGEIRRLEAEAVREKEWTMSGEASAAARPMNSLLDEEVDFEHVGKPVPVITQEISESIEEMIKRRIIDQQFDEVIRRHPGAADGTANVRRGLVEVDDAKAKQSLAEIYEEDHVKKNDPDTYVSKSDEKLRKEEHEVERMWKDLCGKLDALSSWHYKPRPTAPSLTVVADVATIAMEDAQPTTAQGVGGGESMMAPQEVYKAGQDLAEKGEVVAKSGLPVARQEMTREEKLRRRRRQKERIRKSGGANDKPVSKKTQEKRDAMAELKRGGVKVINREGEVVGIDGKKPKAAQVQSSGSFKL